MSLKNEKMQFANLKTIFANLKIINKNSPINLFFAQFILSLHPKI